MPDYEWVNDKGEVRVTDQHDSPPENDGKWKRVFSFGVSTVNGAGGSPSRISGVKK